MAVVSTLQLRQSGRGRRRSGGYFPIVPIAPAGGRNRGSPQGGDGAPRPKDILVLVMDGIHMGEQAAVGAVGIDSKGKKHVLGLADGTSENSAVVGDLLRSLVSRGLDTQQKIRFLKPKVKYVRAYMRAAWKLRAPAAELEVSHPNAARSLLERLDDAFTVNRLGLLPLLVASLQTTRSARAPVPYRVKTPCRCGTGFHLNSTTVHSVATDDPLRLL
ncbi:MAG TPA: hypothetical protein VMI31_07345 [Fimbriimonadaceae bacterium]|nr:hypothetical protein [Fimbriimonadaceae bacterium]